MSNLDIQTAFLSNTGGRKRNEDSWGYWISEAGCCWVISDGAGGHGGGDIASRLVVSHVLEHFTAEPVVSRDKVANLLEGAHAALTHAKQHQPTGMDMHATCVVLLIDRTTGRVIIGHVGDSRAYIFRCGLLAYQTRDHSLVQSMIDANFGSADLIRTHPQRSLLTSAIGNSGELTISVTDEITQAEDGDVFLLCSDGWWEYVEEACMQQTLAKASSANAWLEEMADVVARTASEAHDNYTAIGVAISSSDSDTTIILDPHRPEAEPPE